MDLIEEFSVSLKITLPKKDENGNPMKGSYDPKTGKWLRPEMDVPIQTGTADKPLNITAAFVPFTQSASGSYGVSLSYGQGGNYTTSDRQLICSKDVKVPMKSIVNWHGLNFSVEEQFPYEDFADFNVYACKAVSAFD
jgi:hypothetical protein